MSSNSSNSSLAHETGLRAASRVTRKRTPGRPPWRGAGADRPNGRSGASVVLAMAAAALAVGGVALPATAVPVSGQQVVGYSMYVENTGWQSPQYDGGTA